MIDMDMPLSSSGTNASYSIPVELRGQWLTSTVLPVNNMTKQYKYTKKLTITDQRVYWYMFMFIIGLVGLSVFLAGISGILTMPTWALVANGLLWPFNTVIGFHVFKLITIKRTRVELTETENS